MNENTKNPAQKKALGQGTIFVWRKGDKTLIHHINGLTIELNPQETAELLEWLKAQEQEHHHIG